MQLNIYTWTIYPSQAYDITSFSIALWGSEFWTECTTTLFVRGV